MKRLLRIGALAIAIASLAAWLATGGNRGWTRTLVPVVSLDEVTGIEGIRYERRFVPGVDLLGVAALAVALLVVASRFVRAKPDPNPNAS